MNTLSSHELKALLEVSQTPCISIFLPTHRGVGAEAQQDPLLLRHLLSEAERALLAHTIKDIQLERLWEPIKALFVRREIWLHPGDGLAILRSPESFSLYQLPYSVKEQVIVGAHFYLKPLLPLLANEKSFYILALSQNEIRLLKATHYRVKELALPPSVPTSLAETMKNHKAANEVEYHSSASGATPGKGGRQPAIFHGQGVGTDDEKDHLLRYFRGIDRGLHEIFHDETAPLVLAGAGFLWSIYREANTYPHLLPEAVPGNPDRKQVTDEMLRKRAWPLVEASVLKEQQEALAQFEEGKGTDRASDNVSEIVPAAFEGRVKDLFVAIDQEQWGAYDPSTYTMSMHEVTEGGNEELLDLAARQTLLHGGMVYALEQEKMPDKGLLAAVYRY